MASETAAATAGDPLRTTSGERTDVCLSVVLPCFNEEECVGPLMEELDRVLSSLGTEHEVLFVNDASTDGTAAVLDELAARYPYVRVITHSVNCGESAGQATGFREARGEIVITMDTDQQNDPADIPRLLEALEGVDGVCGVRRNRRDDWVKRVSSRLANRFRRWVTADPFTDAGCAYRALRREALAEIPVFNGMHRFLPTMMLEQGFEVIEIDVNHRPRSGGESKYGVGNRLFRGLVDCVAMRWYMRRVFPGRRVERTIQPAEPRP